ncbi:MAG: hypothetical protein ABIN74_00025 [Ferruginibacter sp.]
MKNILFVSLSAGCCALIFFAACNNASKTERMVTNDSLIIKTQTDSSVNYIHAFADTALENKITAVLLQLPFVIKSNRYIDSFSNHKHGIAFMLDNPGPNETDISVQAGYNGDQRFETYYRFDVDPKTLEIKVYDPVTDKKLTVEEYLKTQQ